MRFFYLVLHRHGRRHTLPGWWLPGGCCVVDGWLPFGSVDYMIEIMATEPGDFVWWV